MGQHVSFDVTLFDPNFENVTFGNFVEGFFVEVCGGSADVFVQFKVEVVHFIFHFSSCAISTTLDASPAIGTSNL